MLPPAQTSERAFIARFRPRTLLGTRMADLLWLAAFNLLFFQTWIQNTFGFTYIDELATLALLATAAIKSLRSSETVLGQNAKRPLVALGLMCGVGLLGNMLWSIQEVRSAIAIDLFTCVKFPIALLSACIVFHGNDRLFYMVEAEAKLLALLMFALALANLVFDFGMGADPRYGLRASFMFVLGHPTMVVFVGVGLTIILSHDRKKNGPWIAIALAVVALALRSKGIAFVALAALLLITYGHKERLTVFHALLALVFVVALGWDQYSYYFGLEGAARKELTETSFKVARDFFPTGSGFATFGSAVTADPEAYSPLYYQYGLSNIHGLMLGKTFFLSDTFWPTVLGQFGWMGFLLFIVCLFLMFMQLYRSANRSRLGVIFCFTYLLISSTAESAFFHPMSVYLAFCLGLALNPTPVSGLECN